MVQGDKSKWMESKEFVFCIGIGVLVPPTVNSLYYHIKSSWRGELKYGLKLGEGVISVGRVRCELLEIKLFYVQ